MSDYAQRIIPLIRQTRAMLMPHWGNVVIEDKKSAFPSDVVTKLDKEVEQFLTKELASMYPDISFVGEEFGGDRTASRFFLCDPIDGTGDFVRGLPFSTVMLALIEEGAVVFSVIYDFATDTVYHAERGGGAFRNDEQIHVSTRSLGNAYLFYESHLNIPKNMEIFSNLSLKVGLMDCMCAGYEFAMVASGKVDGRLQFNSWGKDYDFAPGSLLVAEAGGIVANLGVNTYDYRNTDFLAVNPVVFKELTEGSGAPFPIV